MQSGAARDEVTRAASDELIAEEDKKVLHSMGYAQELLRSMRSFQNFAISFSIICILSGGINSFSQGLSSIGGASIGFGWPLGALFSLLFALAIAFYAVFGLAERRIVTWAPRAGADSGGS